MSEGPLDRALTGKEVVTILGAALFKLYASDAARDALHHAIKEAGLPELAPAVQAAEAQAQQAQTKKKASDGKPEKQPKEKKEKKPRSMSEMNLFMALLTESIQKDPTNPAYKMPSTTDENGKTVIQRGAAMQLVSQCWKAMSEQDKQRYEAICGPFLARINEGIHNGEGRPANLGEKLKEWLVSNKTDKELYKILFRCVETATGHNPAKPGAPTTSQATPSKTNSKAVANGTSKKRTNDENQQDTVNKKAKIDGDKSDKKKSKKEKKEEEAKQEAAEKKRKEEEEAKRKAAAAAAAKKADSDDTSSSEESGSESDEE